MTPSALLARAEAAGLRVYLDRGRVRLAADAPPSAALLDLLRQHRDAIAEALAAAPSATPGACQGVTADPEERRCAPAWSEVAAEPPPGAWCAGCGRRHKRGGRWWRERDRPNGWACWTCHPPDHLAPEAVVEVLT